MFEDIKVFWDDSSAGDCTLSDSPLSQCIVDELDANGEKSLYVASSTKPEIVLLPVLNPTKI